MRASAGQGCGSHGSKEPHDVPAIAANHCSHSPPHSFERLLHSACCRLPQHDVGSLGERRHARLVLGFVVLCFGQQCGEHAFLACVRTGLVGRRAPFVRTLRALRPSIYWKLRFYAVVSIAFFGRLSVYSFRISFGLSAMSVGRSFAAFRIFSSKILECYFLLLYLQSRSESVSPRCFAEIAQLVEHNLAKVGVASSSLVFRSGGPFRRTFFVGQRLRNRKQTILYISDMQNRFVFVP